MLPKQMDLLALSYEEKYMWLEQTVWIWGRSHARAVIWRTWRIAALRREIDNLRVHVIQLELAWGDSSSRVKTIEPRQTAA